MQNKNNKKGFTLLETLVVIAMVAIMTIAVLTTLNTNKLERELETAGDQVYSAIRETQNYALTGKEAEQGCDAYSFSFSGREYAITNKVSGGDNCTFRSIGELENNVAFAGSGEIEFTVPHGTVNVAGVMPIILSKEGRSYNVCVYGIGAVTRTRTTCSSTPE
ncbi:Tfp pilus assembly protein FimT/FimU [Patescibacteria group bacterium]